MSDLDVKIQDVANYWNYKMPMMAMEELAETIQAISKVERCEEDEDGFLTAKGNREYLIRLDELKDEIRDVYISLRALMYTYRISEDDIMERVEKKLNKKYKED